MSVDTGFPRQLPAASGPAASIDNSGGKSSRKPFVLKLKTSFLGAPSKSQRTSAPEGQHSSQYCREALKCQPVSARVMKLLGARLMHAHRGLSLWITLCMVETVSPPTLRYCFPGSQY